MIIVVCVCCREQQEDAARADDILASATRDTGEIDIGMLGE
jgi:hypothetical protein